VEHAGLKVDVGPFKAPNFISSCSHVGDAEDKGIDFAWAMFLHGSDRMEHLIFAEDDLLSSLIPPPIKFDFIEGIGGEMTLIH
jgi:hypothetical protein